MSSDSRLSVLEVSNNGQCAVVELAEEDHTLCNALRFGSSLTVSTTNPVLRHQRRHQLVNNSSVKFCGYSMPHPNNTTCVLQIQTTGQLSALDALDAGLTGLALKCQHLKTLFDRKHREFVSIKQ